MQLKATGEMPAQEVDQGLLELRRACEVEVVLVVFGREVEGVWPLEALLHLALHQLVGGGAHVDQALGAKICIM